MIINESMVQMVVSMLLKQLPPGTGDRIAEFFEQKKTLIEETEARLKRIEEAQNEILSSLRQGYAGLTEQQNNDNRSSSGKPTRKSIGSSSGTGSFGEPV